MPKMDEFAKLAQAGAAALNPVNAAEAGQVLARWSEPALRRLEADSEGAARAAKLRAWVGTVARRRFIREGEAREVSVGEAGLPPWAKEALGAGRSAHRLLFSDQERVLFERVADYLAADTGPSAAADWSRISWSQAVEAERRWIEALAEKAAAKDAEAKAAEGAIRVGDEGPDGSRWVRLDTAEALDREGALMRHCVGSYAKSVATKGTRIYSLRDGANKPRLTVELRAGGLDPASLTLAQARGFANEAPKPEDKKELGKLLEAVKAEEGFSVDRFSADAQRLGIGHFRFREASGGSFAATMGLDAEEDEKALERALAEEELCRKNPGLRDFGNLAQIVSCAFASGLPDLAKRADGLLASQSDPRAVGKFYEAYFEFERRRYDAQLAHPGQAEFLRKG